MCAAYLREGRARSRASSAPCGATAAAAGWCCAPQWTRSSIERRRLFGIVMDVTEQHNALMALRGADERAALAARLAGIGTWELDLGAGGGTLGRADVPAARPRAARHAADARRAAGAAAPRRRATWCSTRSRRRSAATTPPTTSSACACPTAAGAGWRRARSRCATTRGRTVRRVGVNWDITESQDRRSGAPAEGAGRAREPGQVAVPLAHEPRTAHAAERGARLRASCCKTTSGRRWATQQTQPARPHPLGRRAPAGADQRRARPVQPGGRHARSSTSQPVPLQGRSGAGAAAGRAAGGAAPGATAQRLRARPRCCADPTRLRQVLINLLSNAIKYNRPRGAGARRRHAPATAA